ncbi:nucleotidyltransferase domain-containing protein [Desulfobacca acetoxidans]
MISKSKIQEAIRLLKQAAQPSFIILFGSYGRGTPREDSDVDLLVVLPEVKDRREEMVRLRRVLRPLRIPVDVLVVSEAIFREWSGTPGNVFFEAAQEGQVLYEAA